MDGEASKDDKMSFTHLNSNPLVAMDSIRLEELLSKKPF